MCLRQFLPKFVRSTFVPREVLPHSNLINSAISLFRDGSSSIFGRHQFVRLHSPIVASTSGLLDASDGRKSMKLSISTSTADERSRMSQRSCVGDLGDALSMMLMYH